MFKRSIVSLSVASVLMSTTLIANANAQKGSDDSVLGWGPWSSQYATAAGGEINNAALAFASLAQGETGRNTHNEAGYQADNAGERQYVSWGKGRCCSPPVGSKSAEILIDIDGAEGSYVITASDEVYVSEVLNTADRSVGGISYEEDYFLTHSGLDWTFLTFEEGEGDYQRGYWYEDTSDGSGWATNAGFFITGVTSSAFAVQGLASDVLAGNVSAIYNGAFLGDQGNVKITVDFGSDAGWVGVFTPDNYAAFDAEGAFEGVNLVGVINSEGVSGTIEASFFGDNANVIAGIAEANTGESGNFVGVFETTNLSGNDVLEPPVAIPAGLPE